METLASLALWGVLLFLMMRFGCGAHAMGRHRPKQVEDGRSPGDELRWIPPARDTDPVCGKTVATDAAKPSVHDGRVHYFCSRECREAFEASPDSYVSRATTRALRQMEHSNG